jgi:penicillin-binding protein 1C
MKLIRSPKQGLAYIALALGLLILLRVWPHTPLSQVAPSSTAILAADGSLLRLNLARDDQYRLWVPLQQISPNMLKAIQLQEDQWFYWHLGFNPISLLRGAFATYTGASKQGGSTLTMQLARLMYQLNTRSAWGKLKQIGYAIWLELRYSKHDIFEAYVNLAPYGYNIQGIPAASLIYFGKTADQLTLPEMMTLAVIPQRPNQRGQDNHSLQSAKARLFKRWQQANTVSLSDERLMELPLPLNTLKQLPFKAPHFSEQLILVESDQHQIHSTLVPKLQHLLERQVAAFVTQHRARGIKNASAILVNSREQTVVAMVGSADYFNRDISGQVNGTLAKRSPGSTLKPFIYGLAFDQGVIHPQSILRDAPTAFGPFQPENFDGRFVGPISTHDALIRSRNIPAVDVASQLNSPSLYGLLKAAGISKLKSEQHYGLALVLGGGEVTMEELASLYTMLGNQGSFHPLRYKQDDARALGVPMMSPEASFMVWDILKDNPRPDNIAAATRHGWDIAWKTGTSWGFRDAWTAGIVGPYVLVVWVGNFDGSPNPAFIGVETAAPLFFRIADALPLTIPAQQNVINIPPRGLKKIKVCSASGQLPNQWCPQQTSTWFIPGKSPIQVSTLHRPVIIDNRTGRAACPPFDTNATHQEIYEFWDSSMMRLFREAGMPRRPPPTADCLGSGTRTNVDDAPKISSPLKSVSYQLQLSKPDETIALQASAAADAQLLYWFSNKAYLGFTHSKSGGLPWRPQQGGWHTITVVDDKSRSASRDVKIEILP